MPRGREAACEGSPYQVSRYELDVTPTAGDGMPSFFFPHSLGFALRGVEQ